MKYPKIADELNKMADSIGLNRKWIQKTGTSHEHYDICLSFKKKAMKLGAIEIGHRQLVCNIN